MTIEIRMNKTLVSNIRGQQSQSRQQKQSVSFKPNVVVYPTKHINDYTEEEIRICWYNEQEERVITSDCMSIIKAMVKDEEQSISSTSDCIRGLEYRTPEGQKRRMSNKFCAMDAVLDEHEMQWQDNKNDVDELRKIYSTYSAPSHDAAHLIGLEDERQAMLIYNREDDVCSVRNNTTIQTTSKVISHEHDQHQKKKLLERPKKIGKRNATRQCTHTVSGRAA